MSLLIGIGGGSGAGKTTLANKIKEILGNRVTIIQYDMYCCDTSTLSMQDRANVNYDLPTAYDSKLLLNHIKALQAHKAIDCPVFDFPTHSRLNKTTKIEPSDIIIVDGIMFFAIKEIFEQLDYRIYVDATEPVRLDRRINRDIKERGRTRESVLKQFYTTVQPMHEIYVEPYKVKADFIFDNDSNNGLNLQTVQTLINEIKELKEKQ